MALPSSGAISLNDIHIEAGGATGTLATINDEDIRALIGKASGATMSFNEWYGASGRVVNFNSGSIYRSGFTSATVTASVTFSSSGTMSTSGSGYVNIGWTTPTTTGIGSSYEIFATRTSGSTPSGSLNSWITIGSNRTWSVSTVGTSGTAISSTIQFQIREVGTTTVLDTETITITAEGLGGGN